jgi:hypothetical protein
LKITKAQSQLEPIWMAMTLANTNPTLTQLIFGDGTPRKAFITAVVVGTILTMINHGDVIISGDWPPFLKVFLTYCTPYLVTTWGAVTGKRAQWQRSIR